MNAPAGEEKPKHPLAPIVKEWMRCRTTAAEPFKPKKAATLPDLARRVQPYTLPQLPNIFTPDPGPVRVGRTGSLPILATQT